MKGLFQVSLWLMGGHLISVSSHCFPSVYICIQIPSSHKDTHQIGLDPILLTSFWKFNPLYKHPISRHGFIMSFWGLELQHINFGKDKILATLLAFQTHGLSHVKYLQRFLTYSGWYMWDDFLRQDFSPFVCILRLGVPTLPTGWLYTK
jgi:hypothetical protein